MGGFILVLVKEEEFIGWEELFLEFICCKMEIDDGILVWGDLSKYNYKNVNMWNKNVLNGNSCLD